MNKVETIKQLISEINYEVEEKFGEGSWATLMGCIVIAIFVIVLIASLFDF